MKRALSLIVAFIIVLFVSLPAYADRDDVVASIEQKAAPDLVGVRDGDGNYVRALLFYPSETLITGVPDGGIIITPIPESEGSIRRSLNAAYNEINNLSSLYDLSAELPGTVKALDPTLTENDLVVRDLFDLSLYGTYLTIFDTEGNYLQVVFDTGLYKNDLLIVMTCCEGVGWKVIDPKYVRHNGDGTTTVIFHELCPTLFITKASAKPAVNPDNPAVASPQTQANDSRAVWLAAAITAFAVGVAGIFMARKVDNTDSNL